jgi:endonuclease/exonuclease/phosphatase family metal-dependent hydrolase
MALRVVTWNMNYCFRKHQVDQAWAYLRSLEVDVALLQESPRPREAEGAIWHEAVAGWGTAVIVRNGLAWHEVPSVPLAGSERIPPGHLERSERGAWAAANVEIPGLGTITAVSVYGLLTKLGNGTTYSTSSVQRTLSDLTPVLDVPRSRTHVIMAGDLNVSPQIPAPDMGAHIAILDRISAFGLVDCLAATHDGLVRTYRHRNQPTSKPWQLDWVFAAPKLKLLSCEPLDDEKAWALSDHCPVLAEFEA